MYNKEKAKTAIEKAKSELESQGVSFPIHLDVPIDAKDEISLQTIGSFKESVESALGAENVVVDIQKLSSDNFERISYFAQNAAQEDYDISFASGWGPDYIDPSTYLDIFNARDGANLKVLGLDENSTSQAVSTVGLDKYTELLDAASVINDNLDSRYEAYAKAQAWLTDSSILLTTRSKGGSPRLSKVVPFTGPYGEAGSKSATFKYLEIQSEPVTTKQYKAAKEKWLEAKEESNVKYQSDLANHIEK